MKIKFRRLPNPEHEGYMLMGMAFIAGEHKMTGMLVKAEADEKHARKIIKRAFQKFCNENQ